MIQLLSIVVAVGLLFGQATPPVPTTAKSNLGAALNGGKKWKADAILIQVAGSRIGADGKHIAWEYGFYSAAAKTCAVVYVAGGQSHAEESGGPTCQAAELKYFMDSEQAMVIARRQRHYEAIGEHGGERRRESHDVERHGRRRCRARRQ